MLSFRKTLLLISFIVGFIIGFGLKVAYQSRNFVVAEWESEPFIVICPSSKVDGYRVSIAVEWWKNKGYPIAGYHFDEDGVICSQGRFVKGIIFIRDKGYIKPEIYAETARFSMAFEVISAEINMPNRNRFLSRLLEHEIGHALGFSHVEEEGHIMHPILERTGERFWIPD
jgi:hypothetical protein